MSTERWEQTKEILEGALRLTPTERPAYLDSVCGADVELRSEIESLIASHEDAGSHFLDTTASEIISLMSSAPRTNQTIGHYRLAEELGRGGMGIVYAAEDLKLGRRVAVKFLTSELAHDPRAFERFEREARAASALDHRNICSIYELGEYEGQPFIVMQFLEGRTLREWIEDTAKQYDQLRERELVDFAIQIADGLEAAHQKGIIHRDIKPANLFITNRGEIKILDFGVAKFLEVSEPPVETIDSIELPAPPQNLTLTATGVAVGTPCYLSPEQIRSERLDGRTDLFSFGLVLYEMATGHRAFAHSMGTGMRDAVLSTPVVPVRELNPKVSPKLEGIITKALEKDRDLRFQSARALQTSLENLRTELGPAARRRKRIRLWAGGAAAAVLLLAGTLYLVHLRRNARQTALHQTYPAEVKVRRSVAVLGFKNLTGQSDHDWLSTALAEMLNTELAAGQQLRIVPGEQVARTSREIPWRDTTALAKGALTRLRSDLNTDYVALGSYSVLEQGHSSLIRLDFRLEDAALGETLAEDAVTGNESDLIDLIAEAAARIRAWLAVDKLSVEQAAQARVSLPSNPKAARLYSEGLAKLWGYDAVAARDLFLKAEEIDPDSAQIHAALSHSWFELGYEAKSKEEAQRAFELSAQVNHEDRMWIEAQYRDMNQEPGRAVEILRTLSDLYPDNLEYGLRLASLQNKEGHPKDALATLEKLRLLPSPFGEDPRIDLEEARVSEALGDLKHERELAEAALEKGKSRGSRLVVAQGRMYESSALLQLGDLDQAIAGLAEARVLFAAVGDLKEAGSALLWSCEVLRQKGDLVGSQRQAEEALVIFRQVGHQGYIGEALNSIGSALSGQGKLREALTYDERALSIYREIQYKAVIGDELSNIGMIREQLGDLAGARKAEQEAEQIFSEVGDKHAGAIVALNLGQVLVDEGDLKGAQQKYESSLQTCTDIGFKRCQATATYGLAGLSLRRYDLSRAKQQGEQALALRKELGSKMQIAASGAQLAAVSFEEGNVAEAEKSAGGVIEQLRAANKSASSNEAYSVLVRALLAEGKLKEAENTVQQLTALASKESDPTVRFESALAAARTDAAAGRFATARTGLARILAETTKSGYVEYSLEARLGQGEVALKSGPKSAARAKLMAVEAEARSKDFLLIAHRASTMLQDVPQK